MHDIPNCPFEVLGFFEEICEPETGRCYGTRRVETPDRPFGYAGRKEYLLTEPLTLQRGHKTMVLKASVKRPVPVVGMLHILCGRMKGKI